MPLYLAIFLSLMNLSANVTLEKKLLFSASLPSFQGFIMQFAKNWLEKCVPNCAHNFYITKEKRPCLMVAVPFSYNGCRAYHRNSGHPAQSLSVLLQHCACISATSFDMPAFPFPYFSFTATLSILQCAQ